MSDSGLIFYINGDTLTDSSDYSHAIENTGVSISNSQSKFGDTSLYFDGSSYLYVQSDDFLFTNGDFTVDWWEYVTSPGTICCINPWLEGIGYSMFLLAFQHTTLYSAYSDGSWGAISGATALSSTTNEWVHWAFVKSGTTISTYKNGILFWSGTVSNNYSYSTGGLIIGKHADPNNPDYFTGYIDDFRVSNYARWTSNFTVPTSVDYLPPSPPNIDMDYNEITEVEYIQSGSGQYIDTGFIPDSNTRIKMKFQVLDYSSIWRCVLGQRTGSSANGNSVALWLNSSGIFMAYWSNGANTAFTSDVSQKDICILDLNRNVYTINNNAVSLSNATFSGVSTLTLGIVHTDSIFEYPCAQRIYYCKIYDNDILVRDYVPCISPSGICGLYDKVNNQFYHSASGTEFTCPINVNASLIFEMDDTTFKDKINDVSPTVQGNPKIKRSAEYHSLRFTKSTSSDCDGLLFENNNAYNLSGIDWTIEWWEYRTGTNDTKEAVISYLSDTNTNGGFVVGSPQNNKLRFFSNSASGTSWDNGIVDIGNVSLNTWVHRVLTFNSSNNTWTAYENGSIYSSGITAYNTFDTSSQLGIGLRNCSNSSYYGSMNGSICGLKIWNGIRYTGNFALPKIPLRKDTSVKLHINSNSSTIKDISRYNHTFTNESVTVSTEHTRDNHNSSLYFNGNSRLLVDYTDDLDLTSDFTIEWWEYSPSSSNKSRFCTSYTSTTCAGVLFGYSGTNLYVSAKDDTSWEIFSGESCIDVVANEWVHRIIMKHGSEWTIYKNGLRVWAGTNATCLSDLPQYKFAIGDYRSGDPNPWTGWIDDFKVYTHAKYTEFTTETKVDYVTSTTTENVAVSHDFDYTGAVQLVTLGKGTYKLECWGAQGGYRSSSSYGGKGGYSSGTLTLTQNTTLYVYSGGAGNTVTTSTSSIYPGGFNGGGYRYGYKGGGGASDIRIGQDSLYARVIVAGGGGSDGKSSYSGGYGGGTTGGNASGGYYSTYKGTGGTQTGNSDGHTCNDSQGTTNSSSYCPGGFGFGGFGVYRSSGYGGAGGGGWYGGEGTYPDGSVDDDYGGGGGSGYIYTSSTASNYPSGCLLNSSYYLTNAQTISGNSSFTSPTGSSETGHTGNGYCRISGTEIVEKTVTTPVYTTLYRIKEDTNSFNIKIKINDNIKSVISRYVKINDLWKPVTTLYSKINDTWKSS